jgi:hypothetical protein
LGTGAALIHTKKAVANAYGYAVIRSPFHGLAVPAIRFHVRK